MQKVTAEENKPKQKDIEEKNVTFQNITYTDFLYRSQFPCNFVFNPGICDNKKRKE